MPGDDTVATMNNLDRKRHRRSPVPQGRVSNWLLVAVAGAFTVAALLARTLT